MQIIINLDDLDVSILNHDLLDIEKWVKDAVAGKINNCKKRMAIEYREKLKREGAEMVPASDILCIQYFLKHKDYKNRIEREKGEI